MEMLVMLIRKFGLQIQIVFFISVKTAFLFPMSLNVRHWLVQRGSNFIHHLTNAAQDAFFLLA
ncbi:hypothetical protein X975_08967, partial [Stegodyphus mimosarum]